MCDFGRVTSLSRAQGPGLEMGGWFTVGVREETQCQDAVWVLSRDTGVCLRQHPWEQAQCGLHPQVHARARALSPEGLWSILCN